MRKIIALIALTLALPQALAQSRERWPGPGDDLDRRRPSNYTFLQDCYRGGRQARSLWVQGTYGRVVLESLVAEFENGETRELVRRGPVVVNEGQGVQLGWFFPDAQARCVEGVYVYTENDRYCEPGAIGLIMTGRDGRPGGGFRVGPEISVGEDYRRCRGRW